MWPFGKRERRARDKPRNEVRTYRAPRDLRMVNRPRADRTLEGNEAIYAAVSRISNTIASMPLHLYRGYEIQEDHPLERLINLEPHPGFSAFSWRQTMEVFRNTEGNTYGLQVLDGFGTVQRIDILNPARVVPKTYPETGESWYEIHCEDGQVLMAPGFLVIHLKHLSANGLKGIRPIDVLRKSLDYDTQVKELSLDQLDGINRGIMLTVPHTGLGAEAKKQVVDQFLETYEKSGKSVVILEGGLTATNFSTPSVDAQLLDVERITRNRVATVYNLPPHMLGDYSDTSFSTAEQQMQEFLQLTITPIVEQWENELNRKLLTAEQYAAGYRFRFDTNSLTRADVATTAQRNQMAIRGGWRKPNEVRQSEGLPPDPNGDELMASRDLIPLRIAIEQPELLLGGGGGSGSGSSEDGNEDGQEKPEEERKPEEEQENGDRRPNRPGITRGAAGKESE